MGHHAFDRLGHRSPVGQAGQRVSRRPQLSDGKVAEVREHRGPLGEGLTHPALLLALQHTVVHRQDGSDDLSAYQQWDAGRERPASTADLALQQSVLPAALLVHAGEADGLARTRAGSGKRCGEPSGTSVIACSRSALLFLLKTVTLLPGMERSRWRLRRLWTSCSFSASCMLSVNSCCVCP